MNRRNCFFSKTHGSHESPMRRRRGTRTPGIGMEGRLNWVLNWTCSEAEEQKLPISGSVLALLDFGQCMTRPCSVCSVVCWCGRAVTLDNARNIHHPRDCGSTITEIAILPSPGLDAGLHAGACRKRNRSTTFDLRLMHLMAVSAIMDFSASIALSAPHCDVSSFLPK